MIYDFIDEYFPSLDETRFTSGTEQWKAWETFVDMLCMLSLVRREQFPETIGERIGTGYKDRELVAALEPHPVERFSESDRIRRIYDTLVKKGELRDMEDVLLPLWQFTNAGMMTDLESMAFIMAALVDRNRKYAEIFNHLMGETGSGYPSVGLVHDLCNLFLNEAECDVAILFDEESLLNRILTVDSEVENRIARHFRLEWIVVKRLFETGPVQLGRMASYAQILEAAAEQYEDTCFVHEAELDQMLSAYATAFENEVGSTVFELIGTKGVGKKYLLSEFAGVTGRDVLCVDMEKLLDEPDAVLVTTLKNLVVIALCELKTIYLEHISEDRSCIAKERFCISTLQSYLRQLVIGSDKDMTEELSLLGTVCRIPLTSVLSTGQKRGLWIDYAQRLALDIESYVEELVQKYTVSPGAMWQVLCSAAMAAEVVGEGEETGLYLSKELLEKQIREQSRVDFGNAVTRLEGTFRLNDLQLADGARAQYEEALLRARNRNIVNETFGFSEKLPYGRGLSILLYGPPGTGKTMAAGVFGNELGLDVYRVDLSQINSKYIGETEKNLEQIFRVAKGANIILFFDEADALFAKRTEVTGSNDKYANSQTAYLLQKIEEYDGISILATNGAQNFDAAFKRRMTYMIPIERPDSEVRLKLWQNVFPAAAPLAENIRLEALAEVEDLTGAQIKAAALSAAYMAAAEQREITQQDLVLGIEREYKKEGRLDFMSKYHTLMY